MNSFWQNCVFVTLPGAMFLLCVSFAVFSLRVSVRRVANFYLVVNVLMDVELCKQTSCIQLCNFNSVSLRVSISVVLVSIISL
jgi:hypothetical protein